jgi:hypothetical protein
MLYFTPRLFRLSQSTVKARLFVQDKCKTKAYNAKTRPRLFKICLKAALRQGIKAKDYNTDFNNIII